MPGRIPDRELLLREVPEDGRSIGNFAIIRELDWEEDKYFRVRDALVSDGVLQKGRGRGGTVRRVTTRNDAPAPRPAVLRNGNEDALYQPLAQVLAREWARDEMLPFDQLRVDVVARQGRRDTGGTWTRPDIVVSCVRTYIHIPGKHLDVWSFEVKPLEALDVLAVYEAAAHSGRVTRASALIQVPAQLAEGEEALLERCEEEALRFGVGLITFIDAADYSTWETRVPSPRRSVDPVALEDFIVTQLPEDTRNKIAEWVR